MMGLKSIKNKPFGGMVPPFPVQRKWYPHKSRSASWLSSSDSPFWDNITVHVRRHAVRRRRERQRDREKTARKILCGVPWESGVKSVFPSEAGERQEAAVSLVARMRVYTSSGCEKNKKSRRAEVRVQKVKPSGMDVWVSVFGGGRIHRQQARLRRERSDFQHLGERLSPASCVLRWAERSGAERPPSRPSVTHRHNNAYIPPMEDNSHCISPTAPEKCRRRKIKSSGERSARWSEGLPPTEEVGWMRRMCASALLCLQAGAPVCVRACLCHCAPVHVCLRACARMGVFTHDLQHVSLSHSLGLFAAHFCRTPFVFCGAASLTSQPFQQQENTVWLHRAASALSYRWQPVGATAWLHSSWEQMTEWDPQDYHLISYSHEESRTSYQRQPYGLSCTNITVCSWSLSE